MRSPFGWDLPPGVTHNDIDRLDEPVEEMSDAEEAIADAADGEVYEDPFLPSVTGQLDAILNDPLADEEEVEFTGKPYEPDETPITEEEARQVIEEMRKAVFPEYAEQMARAFANDTGLEIEVE